MQLIEYDGKELLARHGVALARRRLLAPDEAAAFDGDAMVKAQVALGGRGKAGLVSAATPATLGPATDAVRDAMRQRGLAPWVMLEERVAIASETYLALSIDDVARCPCLLFSTHGGIEVEAHSENVQKLLIDPLAGMVGHRVTTFLRDAGLDPAAIGAVARFATSLWRVFVAEDAELIEINPLVLTAEGKVLPLDAKVILDDQANARHPGRADLLSARLAREALTDRGRRAQAAKLTLVEMPGTVAVLTGGAGLGMATLDLLADAGLMPGCFVDGSGGAGEAAARAKAELVVDRARDEDIRGILVYFTLAATSLASQVRGTLAALKSRPPGKPVVVGLVAAAAAEIEMKAVEARAAFAAEGYPCFEELDEAVAELARRMQEK